MKVNYTEEAIADIVEAISYLNERNPTAAANLDAEIAHGDPSRDNFTIGVVVRLDKTLNY